MISIKNSTISLALLFFGLCSVVEAGGHMHGGMVCNDVNCVPRRITFGYAPTTWRRWPTNGAPAETQPPREQLPTPAKEPTPSTPSQPPAAPSEELPLMPTEAAPAPPSAAPAETEAPLVPPFDDAPPTPPTSPPQGAGTTPDTPPPSTLPEPPAQLNLSPLDGDQPPAMPDEDPFKDELPATPPPSSGKSSQNGPNRGFGVAAERRAAMRWQVAGQFAVDAVEGPQLKGGNREEEPRRLPQVEIDAESRRALPTAAPARTNPLRAAAQGERQERIVRTSNLSAAHRAAAAPSEPLRRNPLRAND